MPCVTYLCDSDLYRHARTLDAVADKDLVELLDEVNSFPNQRYSLRKDVYRRRRVLRRAKMIERYSLYGYVSGPEWQCIHFYREADGGSYDLSKQEMANFLLGFRMAWQERGKVQP